MPLKGIKGCTLGGVQKGRQVPTRFSRPAEQAFLSSLPLCVAHQVGDPSSVPLEHAHDATRLHVKDSHDKVGGGQCSQVIAAVELHVGNG